MRIACPLCGARDRREFTYRGAALPVPALDAGAEAWSVHVHLRENPAGPLEELWQHELGCGAWLKVRRDTVTHAMLGVVLAEDAGLAARDGEGPA
ncbi:sarcosine oxidase subunit delta [Tritonibacter horizontis]|uniref:Sarcosine oxidase subunit delta n=1 Tax=Tritonibacter horizontis TaxID=1768241 RepID=A0A132BUM9_9RHOB|nr:sarcosine oxidase subunit delta [Tritonibacter horizontis]KUP92071.1 sarcosine oxidase subunit delta [Tritonibacter horizontis]